MLEPAILEENPYAAPADESNANAIDTRLPSSTYLYAAVVFFLGGVASGFVAFAVTAVLSVYWPPFAFVLLTSPFAGVFGGVYAGRRMFRRLSDLHHQKVEWQLAEAERLGDFYTW